MSMVEHSERAAKVALWVALIAMLVALGVGDRVRALVMSNPEPATSAVVAVSEQTPERYEHALAELP